MCFRGILIGSINSSTMVRKRVVQGLDKKVWSASSIKTFERCPYKFKRVYVDKEKRDSVQTRFGSGMHEYADLYAQRKRINKEKLITEFKVSPLDRADFDYAT